MNTQMHTSQLSRVERSLSTEGLAFAALSGDYNPLHLDSIAARRTPFGTTVVHGVHLFLSALDEVAEMRFLEGQEPLALAATFHQGVPTSAKYSVCASAERGKVQVVVNVCGSPALTATIDRGPGLANSSVNDAEFGAARPLQVDFPPVVRAGTVPLRLSRARFAALFPSLARQSSGAWVADVLATTQIVGMVCPGMDSIYSGFRLRRRAHSSLPAAAMAYELDVIGQRSRMVRLKVTGSVLAGTVEAFFRPKPVQQRAINDVASLVPHGSFSGQRALIVGGSRGLGEVTAKILAAGGATTALTYNRGRGEAEKVCAELCAFGSESVAYQLELPMTDPAPEWLTQMHFSHVYFFASPPIRKNFGVWDEAMFNTFANIYVHSFRTLVECVLAAQLGGGPSTRFLYPSSIFVAESEDGFAEYIRAKTAGEALCDQLQGRLVAKFSKPRLPRLRTDQTNAIAEEEAADPVPVMLEVIREFCNS